MFTRQPGMGLRTGSGVSKSTLRPPFITNFSFLRSPRTVTVPTAPKLTTRVDCVLTRFCRVAAVVNLRSAQPAETDQSLSGGNKIQARIPPTSDLPSFRIRPDRSSIGIIITHVDRQPRRSDINRELTARRRVLFS